MSEAVDYRESILSTFFYEETDRWGNPTDRHVREPYGFAGAVRRRPKSTSTRSVGGRFVDPTNWQSEGALVKMPLSTGTSCIGLPYGFKWSHSVPFGGVGYPLYYPSADVPDYVVERAVTQALLNLRGQKLNLGVALAEGRETVGLVTRNAKRISNLLSAAYRGSPKDWLKGVKNSMRRNWNNIPSYYLEHIYGVQPLLSDIDGACKELAGILNRSPDPYITVTGRASDTDRIDYLYTEGQFAHLRERGTDTRTAVCGLTASVPNWVMSDFDRLGLTNPAVVLYERVPYSFVLDWILPVGNWLSALDVGNYLTFVNGFITRWRVESGQLLTEEPYHASVWTVRDDIPGKFRRYAMRRAVLDNFPTPSFPSLKESIGLDQMTQALALVTQLVQGHIKQSR